MLQLHSVTAWHNISGHHLTGLRALQEAIFNRRRLSVETLLGSCRQQKASDEMLLFIRAVCGAGLMVDWKSSWECLQPVLLAEKVACRSVLAPLLMFPTSMLCLLFAWMQNCITAALTCSVLSHNWVLQLEFARTMHGGLISIVSLQ